MDLFHRTMTASGTMAITVTHKQRICQRRYVPLVAQTIVYIYEAAIVRLRFRHYEIIVAINGIKSPIFNSVNPYYGCFRDETLN